MSVLLGGSRSIFVPSFWQKTKFPTNKNGDSLLSIMVNHHFSRPFGEDFYIFPQQQKLGRFPEGTGFREPVPEKLGSGPEALFRVQKVASPRFRMFRCSMGSEGLGSVPEVWTERVLGTRFREPEVLRRFRAKVPKLTLYFESILLYFENIVLYVASIFLNVESMLLYFESVLLYFESKALHFESKILYFESIFWYFESILFYFESALLCVERILLYVESTFLYFERARLDLESIVYFCTLQVYVCTLPQCLGKEKVVITVYFTNANLLAVGDTTYA